MPDCAPTVTVVRGRTLSLCCPHRSHLLTSCGSRELLKFEFIDFFLSGHRELAEKQKPPTIKARRFQSSGGVFCSASSPAAHRTGFPFPPKAPWPPLPGCWTPIGVALDVSERLVNPLRACNKI